MAAGRMSVSARICSRLFRMCNFNQEKEAWLHATTSRSCAHD
jgi:hypothetical protein